MKIKIDVYYRSDAEDLTEPLRHVEDVHEAYLEIALDEIIRDLFTRYGSAAKIELTLLDE